MKNDQPLTDDELIDLARQLPSKQRGEARLQDAPLRPTSAVIAEDGTAAAFYPLPEIERALRVLASMRDEVHPLLSSIVHDAGSGSIGPLAVSFRWFLEIVAGELPVLFMATGRPLQPLSENLWLLIDRGMTQRITSRDTQEEELQEWLARLASVAMTMAETISHWASSNDLARPLTSANRIMAAMQKLAKVMTHLYGIRGPNWSDQYTEHRNSRNDETHLTLGM